MLQNHYNGKKQVITLNNSDYSWSQITHQKKNTRKLDQEVGTI